VSFPHGMIGLSNTRVYGQAPTAHNKSYNEDAKTFLNSQLLPKD